MSFGSRSFGAVCLLSLCSTLLAQPTIVTGDQTSRKWRAEISLQADGGTPPYTWAIASGTLPPGLALRTDAGPTGIMGIPTTEGVYTFDLRVTDSASQSTTRTITWTVLGMVGTTDWELPDASVGVAYSSTVKVAGASGAVSFSVSPGSSLPPGLSLNASTGEISGVPTTAGPYGFVVDVTDSAATLPRSLQMQVSPMRITSPAALPNGTQGTPYSQTIVVAGSTPPYSFGPQCCLPGWLSVNPSTGELAGTPNGPGFWSFTIDVADATGAHLRKHYQLGTVGVPPVLPNLAPQTFEDLVLGEYVVAHLGISGGTPPYTWSVTSGALPPGMRVENPAEPRPYWQVPGAWFVGTPTTVGVYTFTVQVTDSSTPAVSTSVPYTVRVSPLSFDWPPSPELGVPYSHRLRIVGGQPPYTVETIGRVPAGLTVDASGLISGTVAETGNLGLRVRITDNAGATLSRGMNLSVWPNQTNPVNIFHGWLGNAMVNQPFQFPVPAWGGSGTYVWSVEPGSSLPPGLTLSGVPGPHGFLSGTPTASGEYAFTVRATDTANPANYGLRSLYLVVSPLGMPMDTNLRWGNAGTSYSTTLSISGATGTVTWTLEPGSILPPGLTLSSTTGVLSGTPTSAGQYGFELRATDSGTGSSVAWYFQVSLYPPGDAPPLSINIGDQAFRLGWVDWPINTSGGSGTGHVWSVVSGTLPPGVVLRSDIPSWYTPGQTAGLVGVATTPGTYTFTLQVTDSAGKTATKTLNVTIESIVLVSSWELPHAVRNVAYDERILAAGGAGPLTFALDWGALPSGLTLASDGRITGTPTTPGSYDFGVRVTDGVTGISNGMRIQVPAIRIDAPDVLPNATRPAPYSYTISVTGGTPPYTFSMGCCPQGGLMLDPNTGVLNATFHNSGYRSIELMVNDSAGNWGRKIVWLGVADVPPSLVWITTPTMEDLTVGWQNWQTIGVSGGTPPYTWSLTSGSLPPGIVADKSVAGPWGGAREGLIVGGTPIQAGTYTFTVEVTDSASRSTSRTFNWRVSPIGFVGLPSPVFGVPYSQQVRIAGGSLPYSVAVVQGDVPDGLTVSSSGLISGTPRETGNLWFQLRVTGAAGEYLHGHGMNVDSTSPVWINIHHGRGLGEASLNVPWEWHFNAGGGTPPYTWTVEPGSTLPSGLSFASAGVLSGTPTAAGVRSFRLRATDQAGNFAVRRFDLNVTPVNIQVPDLGYGNLGSGYSLTLSSSGGTGAVTWAVAPGNPLPPGLTLSPTGTISGSPTVTGLFNFAVTATDSTGATRTQGITLSVYPAGEAPPLSINLGDPSWRIGRVDWRLEASGGTGTGYGWTVVSGSLPPGLAIRTDTPTWIDPSGMARIAGVATTPGTYNFTLQVTDSGGHSATKAISVRVFGLVTTSDWELPDASVGVPYGSTITTAGATGAVSFAVGGGSVLPPGLTLDPSTGVLSGTPTTAGGYHTDVFVSDSVGSVHIGLNLYVSPMRIVSPAALPNGTQNTPYSQNLTVAGGTPPYSFQLHCCSPHWLNLDPATGVMTGTPDGPGFWGFTVQVSDFNGAFLRKHYQVGVVGAPLTLPGLFDGRFEDVALGDFVNWPLGVYGGTPPYTFSVTAGALPPGVTIQNPPDSRPFTSSPGPLLVGTPNVAGVYTFTVQATDSSSPAATTSREYTLRVSSLSFDMPPAADYGAPYSGRIRVLGGTAPYTVALESGSLPHGLSMDAAGLITGTPAETGNVWSRIIITDDAGNTFRRGLGFWISTHKPSEINIDGGDLGTATVNQGFGRRLHAWGGSGTYNWQLENGSTLPPGLTLSGGPGFFVDVVGTPTASGSYFFTLRATDTADSTNFGVRRVRLSVVPLILGVNGNLGWSNAGGSYTTTLTVQGATGTVTWTADPDSSLPPGLSLSSDGVLSGTPAFTGHYSFNVRATDSGTGASNTWNLQISFYPPGEMPPLAITLGDMTWNLGRVDWRLDAVGGTGTGYTWALVSGALPPGVALRTDTPSWLDPAGMPRLAGVATTPGVYNFTLQVTDSGAHSATKALAVTVPGVVMTSDWELPDASVGVPYSKTITTAGATGTVSFSLRNGNVLPPGLSLNSSTGVLSGTPTAAGGYGFDIGITDSTGTFGTRLNLNVSPMRIVSPTALPNGTENTPYSRTITVAAGNPPYSYRLHCCSPGWLQLDPATGVLSGTPDGPGFWGFTVQVTDSTGMQLRKHYQLGVVGAPVTLPGLSGEHYEDITVGEFATWQLGISDGTPPYTFAVTSGALPPGMSIQYPPDARPFWSAAGAALMGTPTTPGVYTFTVTATDSSTPAVSTSYQYTFKVSRLSFDGLPQADYGAPYSQRIHVLGGTPPYSVALSSGHLPHGLSMDATGLVAGTPAETGNVNFQVTITDDAGNTYRRSLGIYTSTHKPSEINIDPGNLGTAEVNRGYGRRLHAWGGTYNWELESGSSLPPGLTLSGGPGFFVDLIGTPTTVGEYSFTLRATDTTDPTNFGLRRVRLSVVPLRLGVNGNLGWSNAGGSYTTTLTVQGATGTVTWTLEPDSNLPPGLALSSGGILSGTPTSAGHYWFSVRATDSGTGASATWGLQISLYPAGSGPPLNITTGPDFGTWSIGRLQQELRAEGGNGSYTWSLTGGTLPPGVALRTDRAPWFSSDASAGLIGLATTPGTYNFTLQVSDGTQTDSRAFTLKVVSLTPKDPGGLPDATVGQPYSHALSNAGPETVTWSYQPGNPLPPGLTVSSTGIISGTPTAAGYYNFSVWMSDGVDTVSRGFGIQVNAIRITSGRILPAGTQNNAYTHAFTAAGTTGDLTWNADWTPPGLTMLPNGTLTGTPTQAGTWNFPVTVTDSASQFLRAQYSLNVVGVPPILPSIGGGQINDLSLGVDTNLGFSVNGGTAPYTWSATGLPPGMSIRSGGEIYTNWDPAGAIVWGTPTALGTSTATITATDSSTPPVATSRIVTFKVTEMVHDGDVVPYGTRGQPYEATLRTIGGTLPYSWSLVDGWLPAGLSLSASTGVVTGTPLENARQCPRVQVTDAAAKTFTTTYCFDIGGGATTININTGSDLGSATLNQSFSSSLWAGGAPAYIWSVESGSTLPSGLSLSPDGVLSGTPTTQGVHSFLIRAADSANTSNYGVRRFILNVTPLVVTSNSNLGFTNVGSSLSHTPAVAGNTGAVTWTLAPGSSLPPGITLASNGLLSGTLSSAGNYNFNLIATDASGASRNVGFNISIYPAGVAPPLSLNLGSMLGPNAVGPATWQLNAGGGYPPYTYSYAPGATPVPGMRVQTGPPYPTHFQPSTTGALLGLITTPGDYPTTIRVTDSHGQTFDRATTIRIVPVLHTSNDWLPRAVVGSPYSFTFAAAGGSPPYTWTVQQGNSLPAGLSLSSAGVLSETPTTAGTTNFRVVATDAAGVSLSWNYNLEVLPFEITTPGVLPQATAGSPYSLTLGANASGVTWSWAGGGPPGGITLNSSTGTLAGTPSGPWYGSFTIRATSSGGQTSLKTFSMVVRAATAAPLSIGTTSPLPDVAVGRTWWMSLNLTGGIAPYTWSLESGSLPPGIELVNQGQTVTNWSAPGISYLTGRATTVGDYTFTLRVTDAASPTPNTTTRAFTLHVAPVSNEYENLPISGTTLVYNAPYSQPLLGLGGDSTYAWTAEADLPPGLVLSAGGTVSGTPLNTGFFWIPVRLTDATGATILRTVQFDIRSGTAATLNIDPWWDLGVVTQGSAYNRNMTASGSPLPTPNYSFTAVGGLPPGCALQTGNALPNNVNVPARLACNLTASGVFTFTLRVQDAAGNIGVKTFTLRITPNAFFTGSGGLFTAATGVAYSQRLLAWGSSQTWSLAPGSSLPAGLTLASDGTLSGTPSSTGEYAFGVNLTDASGITIARTYYLTVAGFAITTPSIIPVHAIAGEPYTYTLTASGAGSRTWSVDPGVLPQGITLSSGGTLSGTTALVGNYSFYVEVTDGVTTTWKLVTFVVRDKYSVVSSGPSPADLGDYALGQAIQTSLNNTGGTPPYTWTVAAGSSLPPGLTLISGADLPGNSSPVSTVLAGIPTAAGQYAFTLRLTDAAGTTTERRFTLRVSALSLINITPRNATRNSAYSQTLTAVGGTPPYSFALTNVVLPPGMTLSSSGVISGTTTNTGSWPFQVRVTDSEGNSFSRYFVLFVNAEGLTQQQTISIGPGPTLPDVSVGKRFSMNLNVSGGAAPYAFSVVSGTLPPGIYLAAEYPGPGQTSLLGRPSTPGVYTFTIRVQGATGVGYKTLTQRVSPIQVLEHDLFATAGTAAAIQIKAVGGTPPYSFTLPPNTSVPRGLILNANGSITGTTAESGSYSFPVTVTDNAGNSLTDTFSLRVWPAGVPVPLVSGSEDGMHEGGTLSPGAVDVPYLVLIEVQSGVPPYSLSVVSGSLPPGLTLISGTASHAPYLLGAPSSAGDYTATIRITDAAGQTLDGRVTAEVLPASLSVTPDPLPPATAGTAYSVTMAPAGGSPPYTLYLLPESDLPPGMALTGMTLSGTPTAPGRFSIRLRLSDNAGMQIDRRLDLWVDSATTPVKAISTSPGSVEVTLVQGSTPAPLPVTISSGAAPVSFSAVVVGIAGASLSATSGTTPQSINLLLPAGLALGKHYGVIEINSPAAPNTPLPVRVVITVVAPPPCSYAVSPATATMASGVGSGSLNVTTQSYCAWSATSSGPVTITSPTSGTGNGIVTYSLGSNPGTSPRTATITVNGQTHTITQFGSTCAFTIDPSEVVAPAVGGSGVIGVTASLAGCDWTASSVLPWVQITSGSSGTGTGSVTIALAANGGVSTRSGSITIAGQPLAVSQAGAGCIVSLSSGGAELPAAGGPGAVTVTTNGCPYSVVQGPSWITATDDGAGTLSYTVAANSTTEVRTGSFSVSGQPYRIVQAAEPCSFTVTSTNPVFAASGGTGSISVAANGSNCGWSASSGSAWLPITSGGSGTSSGQVNFSVAANSSPQSRAGSIVVAGQTVTLNQSGITCSYDLRSSSGTVPAIGGTGTAGVISASSCTWNATSNAGWLSVTSGAGSGTGDVVYAAQPNPTAVERSGTLTIQGQSYTVTQPGAPCAYTITGPAYTTVGPDGASSSFPFTANQPGCTPAAVGFANWIGVSTSFEGTEGTVSFTAAANPLATARAGNIQIGNKTFTVNQTAAACAFSLNAFGAVYNKFGGEGSVLASASALGCSPAIGASPELLPLGPLGQNPATRIWTQEFTVPLYESLNPWVRVLYISVSGELFSIKQTSWQ